MAKELSIGPGSLIKYTPAPAQRRKAPVEDWVHERYDVRQREEAPKNQGWIGGATPSAEGAL